MITSYTYESLITREKVYQAWSEFKKGKEQKIDVQLFKRNLEDNLYVLEEELRRKTYTHGGYASFYVNDPKRRHIHKAPVRDRLVHHLLYTYLYSIFDRTFIYDSYSCRLEKGTHKGVQRLITFARKASKNYTKPCISLQCDIQKFFANVDHTILLSILKKKIQDQDILHLLSIILFSFQENGSQKGIPLGNLTSQIFANIYLNELDQFIKHDLRIQHYIRYADDFIIIADCKEYLERILPEIRRFLTDGLALTLHPKKIKYRSIYWGIDFLGYIVLPHYTLPRTKTRNRLFNKVHEKVMLYKRQGISKNSLEQTMQSYLGYLSHANSFKLTNILKNQYWFWLNE